MLAALALQEFEAFDTQGRRRRRTCKAAIERVAARLGNTPTICRKCYIHPEVLNAYVEGDLLLEIKEKVEEELREDLARCKPEEAAVLAMLEARLKRTLEGSLKESLAAVKKKRRKRALTAGLRLGGTRTAAPTGSPTVSALRLGRLQQPSPELPEGEGARQATAAPVPHFTSIRSTSATLHACAMQPRGVNGGSASKISLIEPTQASLEVRDEAVEELRARRRGRPDAPSARRRRTGRSARPRPCPGDRRRRARAGRRSSCGL